MTKLLSSWSFTRVNHQYVYISCHVSPRDVHSSSIFSSIPPFPLSLIIIRFSRRDSAPPIFTPQLEKDNHLSQPRHRSRPASFFVVQFFFSALESSFLLTLPVILLPNSTQPQYPPQPSLPRILLILICLRSALAQPAKSRLHVIGFLSCPILLLSVFALFLSISRPFFFAVEAVAGFSRKAQVVRCRRAS